MVPSVLKCGEDFAGMQDAAAGRSVTRGWRHVPNGLPIERRIN